MQPSSLGPPSHDVNVNGGGCSSFHDPAKYDDRSCWSCPRMLTAKPETARMCRPAFVSLPRQNSTSGGSSDNDVNEFAVIARTSPSLSSAITVTPVTKRPSVWRRVRGSRGSGVIFLLRHMENDSRPLLPLRRRHLLHDDVDIIGADQIRHRPAVEVVLGHALLGEPLVALGRA